MNRILLSSFRFTPFPNRNLAMLFNSSPPTVFETTFVGTDDVIAPTIMFDLPDSFNAPPLIGVFKILFLSSNGTAPPTKSLLPVLNPFILFPEVIGTYRELGISNIYSM